MGKIKTNERELAGKVCEWFNEHISRNTFPFKEATQEAGIQLEITTKFGDLILWTNRQAKEAYTYLELKPPFADKENLETFRQKAVQLNVRYAYTWDFQTLEAYEVTRNKVKHIGSEPTNILKKIDDWLRGDVQAVIKAYIKRICTEVVRITEVGKFTKFQPEKVYFVNLLREVTTKLIPEFEKFFKEESRDKKKKAFINEYVVKQGITFPSDNEFFKLLARQRVYGLITKIIFYLTVRRYFEDLPELYQSDEKDLNRLLKIAFAKAKEKDWQAVFDDGPIEELGIPKDAFHILHELFSELRVYQFGDLPEDVIGELFEEIIDPEQRHSLGQYFTREDLVDFVIGTVVHDKSGFYCDPTCGSGTFLIRLYDRLKYLSSYRTTHDTLLNQIWGVDYGKFPAELSTINLFRQDVKNFDNFPKVIRSDIFNVHKGKTFPFPPPHAGKFFKDKVNVTLPEFHGMVGNFPYIRQELIEKKDKGYKQELTRILAEEYLFSYPSLFVFKGNQQNEVNNLKFQSEEKRKQIIEQLIAKEQIGLKLSGQADIYAYIFLHTTTLLAEGGSFAIITSNSWLDVSYGAVLKQFFLDHFKVKMIVASWAEPWFDDAAVNTVVTVLEKENDSEARNNNIVRFVKLKQKFEELIPYRDLRIESTKRWERIDGLVRMIENAEYDKNVRRVSEGIISFETKEMRIRMVKQSDIQKELQEEKDLAKWGKYLRAPDVYFEILEKCKDKLVPLKTIADVRFGIKTGINEFFYLKPINALNEIKNIKEDSFVKCRNDRGWEGEIEACYLQKVIKDPSKFENILIKPEQLSLYVFICNKDKSELKILGHLGALKYIEWGEVQTNKSNVKFPQIKSVRSRKYWYGIKNVINDEILYLAAPRQRFLAFHNKFKFLIDKRLYSIRPKNNKSVITILNSFISMLHMEAYGRDVNNGNAKEFTVDDVKNMLVPKDKINYDFGKLATRKINPIFTEVKQKDRKALDTEVLKALGLDVEEYLPRIYEGLCEMVLERLELPKMRKKQQKAKVKISYDQVKQSVIADCLPDGVRRFPEDFYDDVYEKLEFELHPTTGLLLTIDQFMGQFELRDSDGKVVLLTDSDSKAEFALLLARQNILQLKIPKKEKTVDVILKNYRQYVKGLSKTLEEDAHKKLHDWSIAERMAKEILEEYGV